jgi:hypothetical protein
MKIRANHVSGLLLAWSWNVVWISEPAGSTRHVIQGLGSTIGVIQSQIDSAADGDTILVGPGTYFENIDFQGKNICLRSISGAASTILDGSNAREPVITCRSGESSLTLIQGFTITGGFGHEELNNSSWGGGIMCLYSQPRIVGNIITSNRADTPTFGAAWGGGVFLLGNADATPVLLVNNTVSSNHASGNGGGAWLEAPCLFMNNVVTGNRTDGDGAGLYITGPAMEIRGNEILNNEAADHGGGAYITRARARIYENLFLFNVSRTTSGISDCSGAGIWLFGYAVISNNTIAFNEAFGTTELAAGGICVVEADSRSIIDRNIISKNLGGGVIGSPFGSFQHTVQELSNNILWGNQPVDVNASSLVSIEETGDFYEDPLFCIDGVGTDGSVSSTSPALSQNVGAIGAISEPGCGPVGIKRNVTWGSLKAKYYERSPQFPQKP